MDLDSSEQSARTILLHTIVPGWIAVGILTIAFWLGVTVPPRYRWVPLAASVFVVGFPHGAVDHLVVARVRDEASVTRSLARVGLTYAILGGGYALVWALTPGVAVTLFLLVTIVHWGTGEVYPLLRIAGVDHLGSSTARFATATVRGMLPILLPLLAFPDRFLRVVSLLLAPFVAGPPSWIDAIVGRQARVVIAVGVGTVVVVTLACGAYRVLGPSTDQASPSTAARVESPITCGNASVRPRTAIGGWLLDVGETLLLCLFFVTVPPVLAVGTYFCLWHSLRHVGRVIAIDDRSAADLDAGRFTHPLWRFARDAAPLTAGGLAIVAGVFLTVPQQPGSMAGSVAVYLVAIAVLTVPHTAIVAWADRKQGAAVWPTG